MEIKINSRPETPADQPVQPVKYMFLVCKGLAREFAEAPAPQRIINQESINLNLNQAVA